MMREETFQMELDKIVIILDAVAPIPIGRDPIGIDLKDLLELKFLKKLLHTSTVEHMLVVISAKAPTPNL